MNNEKLFKVQAYLDGELPSEESEQVANWLTADGQVRAIYDELSATKSLISANEPEMKLPETREFYWSKIRREIDRLDPVPISESAHLWHSWWVRLAAPLTGAALAIAAIIWIMKPQSGSDTTTAYLQEIETPIEEASAISFHSREAGMTVVWIESQGD